jgi:hypothetical protein
MMEAPVNLVMGVLSPAFHLLFHLLHRGLQPVARLLVPVSFTQLGTAADGGTSEASVAFLLVRLHATTSPVSLSTPK